MCLLCSSLETAFTDLRQLIAKAEEMVRLAQDLRERTAAKKEGAWMRVCYRAGRVRVVGWIGTEGGEVQGCCGGARRTLRTSLGCDPAAILLAGGSEAGGEGEEGLDAETALELVNLGVVVSPVTRETAGSLYHQELARQVGVHWVGWVHGGL